MSVDTSKRNPYDIDFNSTTTKLPWFDKIVHAGHSSYVLNMPWVLFGYYLMFFYTDIVGLSPAIAGTIMFFSRLLDCFTDLLLGYLIDNVCFKWGRYRSWMMFGMIPMWLLLIGVFTALPTESEGIKITWAAICYGCFGSIGATLCAMPSTGQLMNMTKNIQERATIATLKGLYTNIAQVVVASFFLPLVNLFGGGNMARGFFWAATFMGFTAVIFVYLNIKQSKKYELNEDGTLREHLKQAKHESLFKQLKYLGANRPAIILVIGQVLQQIMQAVRNGVIIYIFTYYFMLANFHPIAMFANTLAMVAGVVLLKPSIKLFRDTNRAFIIIMASNTAIYVCMFLLIKALGPGSSAASMQFGLLFVLFVLSGVLMGAHTSYVGILLPNTIDYGHWKTGKSQPGLVTALYGFAITIGAAIGGQVLGILINHSGYIPNTSQSDFTLNALLLIGFIVPALLMGLQFVLQIFFGLSDKKHAQCMQEISIRESV